MTDQELFDIKKHEELRNKLTNIGPMRLVPANRLVQEILLYLMDRIGKK